uniref:Chaperone protein n=1 Tax=Marseillevirus LCMAC103 TaxID=2506604 RepID=A0A481YTW6_9VIRU|nr:MAG: chaperone protein [Marseillevirus LCMAC103]
MRPQWTRFFVPPQGGPPDLQKSYQALDLAPDATLPEIKTKFKRLAKTHHPDHGGSEEKFCEIKEAYDALTAARDGRRRPAAVQRRRTKDVVHELRLSLRDVYTGVRKKLALTRNVICLGCAGSGARHGKSGGVCAGCDGAGTKFAFAPYFPEVVADAARCRECRGTGRRVARADRCAECRGARVVRVKKTLECVVDRGAPDGHTITYAEAADEEPGAETGDVHIVVRQIEDPVYQRLGDDLVVQRDVALRDALCGAPFRVALLDGGAITAAPPADCIVTPGTTAKIVGKGMPVFSDGGETHLQAFGDLYVGFSVVFPTSLSARSKTLLAIALQAPDDDSDDDSGVDSDAPTHAWSTATPAELHDLEMAHRGQRRHGSPECRVQ